MLGRYAEPPSEHMAHLIHDMDTFFARSLGAAAIAVAAISPSAVAQSSRAPTGGPALASDPTPTPAVETILELFASYDIVALPEAHGIKDLNDFLLSLVRNSELPQRINDIVIECGNSLYQQVLDRYVAGDSVPLTEIRRVWRNTTQEACATTGFFAQLVPLVRRINQRLDPRRRIRVLAPDPPIDWDKPSAQQDGVANRDASISAVVQREVLAKHRKALLLFGTFHVLHASPITIHPTAVSDYEKSFPGRTFVIAPYIGFGNGTPLEREGHELEARLSRWPIPSVAQIKGTWLGALGFVYFFAPPMPPGAGCEALKSLPAPMRIPAADVIDGILYLGPKDLLLRDIAPPEVLLDSAYLAELRRRSAGTPLTGALDTKHILERSADVFAYRPSRIVNGPVCSPR